MKIIKRFTLFGALFSVLLLAGCTTGNGQISTNAKNITNSGKLAAVNITDHDWGDINIKGGLVEHRFEFRNDGTEDLYLKSAKTSCMCTSARYNLPDGGISPKYGMHPKSNSWSAVIKPGETFGVDIWFDPMAHGPKSTGPIRRTVTLITSSKPDDQLTKRVTGSVNGAITELFVNGNVLSEEDYKAKNNS